ncbi:MAG: LPS assembly lipoprotein LptE [Pseudomonadota bacterium]|nr:LPS assembly lipoprotein LptE [Pseudomonadota bacterium]MDO7667291.1 LPS assembly lipoprotein LptE [Pseudomonadota bacterium]MDO7711453.1 LPS assembly lipoprotein LptE [Pseudomonadota bacterium]
MSRSFLNVFMGLLLIAIAGCGFQLRGVVPLPDSMKLMYVQGINVQQDLGLTLKRGLQQNGVQVVDNYEKDSAVLTVLENKFERRILSVGNNAKVSEYELYGVLKFKITDGQGKLLIEPQQLEAIRNYQFDQTQVLSSDGEEAILREQLNEQLVQSLLRRLSAVK